ncbi:MAG: coproporphyrinogen dehydrogenase HemZ [Clostridiales bacterium]|nr:coproporphyrinogen dehydrogenase HemZ [Clostridiales bacterium]
MILEILSHNFHYEMENLCRVFYPFEKIEIAHEPSVNRDGIVVSTKLVESENGARLFAGFFKGGRAIKSEKFVEKDIDFSNNCELNMAIALFEVLLKATDYVPSWGILTGVRPSKLMTSLISTMGADNAQKYFKEKLLVSPEKTKLAYSVANAEKKIIETSSPNSLSLYISIPFCPTRCSYCSFVSHSITNPNAKKLVPLYVEKLAHEIEITGEYASSLGLRLESIYWGGGTPTAISADEIDLLCRAINNSFNLKQCREYTVEAGRPDTITEEKLCVLKQNGISRISINPQSFNNDVLKNIGRIHTAEKTVEALEMARSMGFGNINMDLIAGLPGDTVDSLGISVDTAVARNPENITVHTLALKRSSTLVTGGGKITGGDITSEMLDIAQNKLLEKGYSPYYMYRQSRSLGNLENVGWCKQGYECLYNVFMMEECHTVLAAGAGAVTKLKQPSGQYIERIFNFKYPYEYISRFDELMDRKKRITSFYYSYK